MSTVLNFTGQLINPIVVYDNVTISATFAGNFKQGDNIVCQNVGRNPITCWNFLFPTNPNDAFINWGIGGEFLSGLTINQILNGPLFTNTQFTLTQTFEFTQMKGFQGGAQGRNSFYIIRPDQSQLSQGEFQLVGNSSGVLRSGNTNYANMPSFQYIVTNTDTTGTIVPGGVQVRSWNDYGVGGTDPTPTTGATMQLKMNVTLQIVCNTSNITSGICFNVCDTTRNFGNCVDTFTEACFDSVNRDNQAFIFTDAGCQLFFQDYLKSDGGPGPTAPLDAKFGQICSNLFPGVNLEPYRNAPPIQQEICACHLDPQIYINLQQSLEKDFPGSQLAAENKVCLFPECASSNYPSQGSGKVCPIPACFELASINNQGQVSGGLTVKQDCQKFLPPGSAHSPGNNGGVVQETKSWLEKNWVWVAIGVGLAIVLIIIVIILASSGKKKTPSPMPDI